MEYIGENDVYYDNAGFRAKRARDYHVTRFASCASHHRAATSITRSWRAIDIAYV